LDYRFSKRADRLHPSPIRELMPYLKIPGIISLGGGYPDPDSFAIQNIRFTGDGLEEFILREELFKKAAQYNPTEGYHPFLENIIAWQKLKNGVTLEESQVVVLNGCQEGLFILAFLLVDRGDCIIVGEPTYPGAIAAFNPFEPEYRTVPCDHDGIRVDVLRDTLEEFRGKGELDRVKFLYTIPNADNPAGSTLKRSRRLELAKLLKEYDLLAVEDDPYELLDFEEGEKNETLQALAGPDHVVRLDSFSKIFIPGLRLGYASAAEALIRRMTLFKQAANLHTASIGQALAGCYLAREKGIGLLEHARRISELYRHKRDRMVETLETYMGGEIAFHPPRGGMFLWVDIPETESGSQIDTEAMLESSIRIHKVIAVPGAHFSVTGGCRSNFRLSFSTVQIEAIDEGIRRLAAMIRAWKTAHL
jgi:2-aminoadipate transaminase